MSVRVVLALAVAALAAAGCSSGGGDGGRDDGGRLSAAEYRAQANAICTNYEQKSRAVQLEGDTPEGVVAYVDEVLPIAREQVRRLEELQPPTEDENRHNAFVLAAREVLASVEALRQAADRRDQAAARAAQQRGETARQRGNRLASQLELEACVERRP